MKEGTTANAPDWPAMCQLIDVAADWIWEMDQHFRYTALAGADIVGIPATDHDSLIGKCPWETGLALHDAQGCERPDRPAPCSASQTRPDSA